MDELTKRYAKALVTELSFRHQLERQERMVAALEREETLRQLVTEPKAPQWKTDLAVKGALDKCRVYQWLADGEVEIHYDHEKAKLRLKVIEERLSLRRALLYAQGRGER